MKQFLIIILLAMCSGIWAAERPNVILILVDDQGYHDLSCYGATEVKTSNIDKMASEGIRFEQFYVNSPICSPSRVAISTGRYPQRYNITYTSGVKNSRNTPHNSVMTGRAINTTLSRFRRATRYSNSARVTGNISITYRNGSD